MILMVSTGFDMIYAPVVDVVEHSQLVLDVEELENGANTNKPSKRLLEAWIIDENGKKSRLEIYNLYSVLLLPQKIRFTSSFMPCCPSHLFAFRGAYSLP